MQAARGAAVAVDQPPEAHPRGRTRWVATTAAVVVAADVVSKLIVVATLSSRGTVTLIPHVLHLILTRNAGAAFGIGTGQTIVFTAVAAGVAVVIARTARTLESAGWATSLGLLLGGALGNLSDRVFRAPAPLRGHVVDWIELPHWPVFNLADSAIVIGGVIAVFLATRGVEIDASPRAAADDQQHSGGDRLADDAPSSGHEQ
jgi:signal peptidase II